MIKKSFERLNLPGRASFFYLLGGAVTKLLGILSTPVFTRLLSTEDYGSYAFYLSTVGIVCGILSPLCSGSVIYRIIKDNNVKNQSETLSAFLPILAFSAIICLFMFTLSKILTLDGVFIIFVTLQSFFDAVVMLSLSYSRYFYRGGRVLFITLFEAISSVIISFLLVYFTDLGYIGRVIGLLIPSAVTAIFVIIITIFRNGIRVSRAESLSILKEGTTLLPAAALGAFSGQFDRLLTAYLLGQSAMAKYSVAHSVGAGLFFVITASSSALLPWILRRVDRGEEERIFPLVRALAVGLGGLTLFLILLSPEAIRILATEEYGEAIYAIFPIALAALPLLFSTLTTAILIHQGCGRGVILTRISSLIFGGISAVLFIPTLGFFGAGLSYFISEISSLVASMLLLGEYRKRLKITFSRVFPLILSPLIIGGISVLFSSYLPLRILLLIIPSVTLLNTLFYGKVFLLEKAG